MTTYKLKLTDAEMNAVRRAFRCLLWHLENEMCQWTDIDEEPPEYMQEEFAEKSLIYHKLEDPAQLDAQCRRGNT